MNINNYELDSKKIIKPAFKENNVPISFFSDDKYVPYLGTAVFSAIVNAKPTTNLDILIFENEYSDLNKQKLLLLAKNNKNISIRFINLKYFIRQLKVNPSTHVSINCFAKLFCTDYIFSNYKKVIVLDSDLLILKDLQDLYNFDMQGKMIAAAKDVFLKIMIKNGYHTDERLKFIPLKQYSEELGLNEESYFNTGVILLDIKKCQENKVQEQIIEINKKYPSMMYAAQDDFNILFKNQWAELEPRWNFQNPYSLLAHIDDFPEGYLEKIDTAWILHFLGKSKPWNDKNVWRSELFDNYAKETEWFDEYLARRKQYQRAHFLENLFFPKGSKRRSLYLKYQYNKKMKSKNNENN